MQLLKQAIGIDISKHSLSVCFGTIDQQQHVRFTEELTLKNNPEGFAALLQWSRQCSSDGVELWWIVEATGVYYEKLAYFLAEHQQNLCVMLANYVKKFAGSTSTKTKTDRVDARLLARMALERRLDRWQPASILMRQLKELTRERQRIMKLQTMTKNRLAAAEASYKPLPSVIERLKQQLALYRRQCKEILAETKQLIAEDPELQQRVSALMSISGVGLTTITTLLAETNGFALVTSAKQLISYAGLDVIDSQSGQHQGQSKISKRGNRRLRTALYMPALSAIRSDGAIRGFYQRICEGYPKTKKPGIIAVARKLLKVIFAIWKSRQLYDPVRIT